MPGIGAGGGGRQPRATVMLDLHCSSEEEARAVWASLAVDDPGSVKGVVAGDHVRITVGPATLPSLRASCDDVLACFQAARGAASATTGRPATDGTVGGGMAWDGGDEDDDDRHGRVGGHGRRGGA